MEEPRSVDQKSMAIISKSKMTIENLGHQANERVCNVQLKLSDELLANIDEMKKMWKLGTRSEVIEQLIKRVFMKSENDGLD